ncbi:hypothetical protein RR48_10506 [Papilio machaon]|uniref:Uncharacterized protein n=1 Tax=Papilio machaon TaxID=76193 RepID=A0A194RAI9_PAPMA|nr:hypothetical protein RR48_10506 [Papilio machaon]
MKFTVDVLGVFLKVVIKVSFVINTLAWERERLCPAAPQSGRDAPLLKINRETFAPLVVSALFIVLTSLLAHAARSAARRLVKDAFLRLLLEEAIAAAELCGCCFELIIVADNFGVATYAVFLFVLTCWWALSWGEATACPYTHLEDVIEGKCDIRAALLKTWAELGGGLLVFKYVQMYWALEISDTHKDRAYQECTADLQVPALYGAVVEGAATCLCRLTSRALADLSPRFATAIDAFIGTSLVVAGVVARDAVLEYRYEDTAPDADLSVSLLCKVHLGKVQLQTTEIKCAVPIEIVTQKVVPLKLARSPAIIPMIPDKEPIIPPSRREGNRRHTGTAMVFDMGSISPAGIRGTGTKQHCSDWTKQWQGLRSQNPSADVACVLLRQGGFPNTKILRLDTVRDDSRLLYFVIFKLKQ